MSLERSSSDREHSWRWQGYRRCAIDLRQGAASPMAAQGVPARVAMEILGHAQISTTMGNYAHIAPEFQKEASERVVAVLWLSRAAGKCTSGAEQNCTRGRGSMSSRSVMAC